MTRSFALMITCAGVCLPAAVHAADWVLPPEAAPAVSQLLGLEAGLGDGLALSAAIQRDHVLVTAKQGEEAVLAVTLRHPTVAAEGADVIGGVALDPTPGPVPEALLSELEARMRASGAEVRWIERDQAPAALDPTAPPVRPSAPDRSLEIAWALHHVRIGERDEAIKQLRALPADLGVHDRLRAATAWHQLEMPAEVARLVAGIDDSDPAARATAMVLTGEWKTAADVAPAMTAENACELTDVANVWSEIGGHEEGRALARAIRERAPDCVAAWEREIRASLWLRDNAAAKTVVDEALARFPAEERVRGVHADVLRAMEDTPAAVDALEQLAREDPRSPGRLRVLLATFLGLEGEPYVRKLKALEARVAEDPKDDVSRFLLGTVYHYRNEFERSNAMLGEIEERLGFEPRVHIYLAMNDFNLGKRDAALARLNRAAELPAMDPDVYYCRGEILRDTDRPEALRQLKHYMTASASSWAANPRKQTRIKGLVESLERCIAEDVDVCPGEWEHPRAVPELRAGDPGADSEGAGIPVPTEDPAPPEGGLPIFVWVGLALIALLSIGVLVKRRARSRTS